MSRPLGHLCKAGAVITSPNVAIKEVKICFKKLKKKIGEKKSRKTRTSAKLQK